MFHAVSGNRGTFAMPSELPGSKVQTWLRIIGASTLWRGGSTQWFGGSTQNFGGSTQWFGGVTHFF